MRGERNSELSCYHSVELGTRTVDLLVQVGSVQYQMLNQFWLIRQNGRIQW